MWHQWQLHNGESTDMSEESIHFYQVMTEVYKIWIWILRQCAPLYPDVKAAVFLCNNEDWKWNTTPAYKKLPFSLSQSICLYKLIELKLKWCLSAKDWDVCRHLRRKCPIKCVMWTAYQVPYLIAFTDRKSGLCCWWRLMLHEKVFFRTERSLQLDTQRFRFSESSIRYNFTAVNTLNLTFYFAIKAFWHYLPISHRSLNPLAKPLTKQTLWIHTKFSRQVSAGGKRQLIPQQWPVCQQMTFCSRALDLTGLPCIKMSKGLKGQS